MAEYYYAEGGTAANLAAATGIAYPDNYMSPATANTQSANLSPDDFLLASDAGGDIRYRMVPNSAGSGTSGHQVTWGAEIGTTPVIRPTAAVTGWTLYSGDIWQATLTREPEQIWMDDTFGDRQDGTGSMENEFDWYWASNVLYIWTGSANDPDSYYDEVEAPTQDQCINIAGPSYITIDGLTCQKSDNNNIDIWNGVGIVVQNCITEWAWMAGIQFGGNNGQASGGRALDCIARYCGDQGITTNYNTGSTMSDHQILRNECYENGRYQWHSPYWTYQHEWTGGIKHWHHDAAVGAGVVVAYNLSYDNGRDLTGQDVIAQRGNGIWFDDIRGSAENPVLCYANCCYGNEACGCFVEISSYIYVFSNLFFDNADSIHTGSPCPAQIKINTRVDWPASYNRVCNNTCVGGAVGIEISGTLVTTGELSYNVVKNNIAVGASLANLRAFQGGENGDDGTGNIYERNCFGAEATDFLRWDSTYHDTYDAFIAASGQTDNNIEADPSFTDAGSDDYSLASDSPCIGAAENLGSPFNIGLMPTTQPDDWPSNVTTGDRDNY